jgi:RNA polymerase sigma factor (sigma-70 family)
MADSPNAGVLRYIRHLVRPEEGERSDAELLQQFAAHSDEAAFTALLQRHGPLVLAACREVLGHAHDAEDAFQATFLVLARKATSIHRREALAAWLHRVAVNIARTARASDVQRRACARRRATMCNQIAAEAAAPTDWRPLLHEELDRLPEKYRAPVLLCYLEGRTHIETAQQLGWPVGTVKGRLARARDLLRARLTRRGLALPGGGVATLLAPGAGQAAVPAVLAEATVRGALRFAAGEKSAAAVSAAAILLAKGAVQTMTTARLTVVVCLLIVVSVGGTGLFAFGPRNQPTTPPALSRPARDDFASERKRPVAPIRQVALRAPAPLPRERPALLARWIAELSSTDGNKRVAATREILKLGKSALPALEKAGARMIVPSHKKMPSRLDVVYSLLKGWADNPPPPNQIYKSDRLNLFLARGWTRPQLFALGRRVGYTVCICERPGWPDAEVQVVNNKTLAELMQALVTTDPLVVSVNLVPAR